MGWNQTDLRLREPRYQLRAGAHMKTPQGWAKVAVRNVSKRGMLLRCNAAPESGSYVEIRLGDTTVVARTVWCDGQVFGVRAQDPIDVAGLKGGDAAPHAHDAGVARQPRAADDVAAAGARAQHVGRHFQFVALALALFVGAVLAAGLLRLTLAAPLAEINHALGGNSH